LKGGQAVKHILPILLALAVGCAAGSTMRDIIVPARAQAQPGPSYEYWTVDNKPDVLAKAGREGWRLAGVIPLVSDGTTVGSTLIFERQPAR
jgi:hypothetical protein